tara:strand:+ start:558 stop:980 length:423 start_codon:yes stop_codon:yes gene_type:complete
MTDKTCKERIRDEYVDRIETIESIFDRIDDYVDEAYDELDHMALNPTYPLDYIPPYTFTDQERGYIRWHLSWGGPSDEFRFFMDEQGGITDIEYHFMDWFDGAVININMLGDDAELLDRVFNYLTGGCPLHLIKEERWAV